MALLPCPACRRHVLAHESVCPFCACGLELARVAGSPTDDASRRSRHQRYAAAALVAGACAIGGATAACAPSPPPETPLVVDTRPATSGAPSNEKPNLGIATDDPIVDAAPTATPTATATQRAQPPPPPPDRHRHPGACIKRPNGTMVCPPYGCVFPDEECDVVRA